MPISRRRFAQLLTLSASAAFIPRSARALEDFDLDPSPLPRTPLAPDEKFWQAVRARFVLPRDYTFLNTANLAPSPIPVIESLGNQTRAYDADPSPDNRTRLTHDGREEARKLLATALGVTPEEIVITRNTSEANNLVSSGLKLGPEDEVIVFSDNHPTNLMAWNEKAKRYGFTVTTVQHVTPHPGHEYYIDAFSKAITPRTRVLGFTHLSSNSGDLFPAAEICRAARERGVLTLLDGAQTFGALDVNLGVIQPDFYSGSAHKWPCGPKETGLLFVHRNVHEKISPSVYGLYPGAVGISRKLEGLGQRDDARFIALAEAVRFRESIGRAVIEARGRELARALTEGLKKLDGVTFWSDPRPDHSGAIVIFKPGNLDPRKLGTALAQNERIIVTTRNGQDRPGLRLAPHVYTTMPEIDRTVAAVKKYLARGV